MLFGVSDDRRAAGVRATRAQTPSRRSEKRLRAILAVAIAGLVALAIALVAGGGTAEQPPATGADALVPADALAYVHLSTDPARAAVGDAVALEQRLPAASALIGSLSARLGAILSRPGGSPSFSFPTDVRPWLGKEAAFALLDTQSATADSLILLGVRDRARAQAFLGSSGAAQVGTYRGVPELGYRSGTVLAFVRHYLAIGQPASVQAAIDAADGSLRSLASNPAYARAASTEPADRVLDAYVSADGVSRVLATADRSARRRRLAARAAGPRRRDDLGVADARWSAGHDPQRAPAAGARQPGSRRSASRRRCPPCSPRGRACCSTSAGSRAPHPGSSRRARSPGSRRGWHRCCTTWGARWRPRA